MASPEAAALLDLEDGLLFHYSTHLDFFGIHAHLRITRTTHTTLDYQTDC